jgi:hypothetical protein
MPPTIKLGRLGKRFGSELEEPLGRLRRSWFLQANAPKNGVVLRTREERAMKRLRMASALLPFFAGFAFAGQPQPLTDNQMDRVTAGVIGSTSPVTITVSIYGPAPAVARGWTPSFAVPIPEVTLAVFASSPAAQTFIVTTGTQPTIHGLTIP